MFDNSKYTNWHIEQDDRNLIWLTLDRKNSNTNTLNAEVLQEFYEILVVLDKADPMPKGLIIKSSKKNGFIAGADINQFKDFKNVEEAIAFIMKGSQVFSKLEKLKFPTVAMIHGFCLGGGFELALACKYRIALDDVSLKIGLPEVFLGLHPGWGGSVRLPKLIDQVTALELMITGRVVSGYEAKKLGMIDELVPLRYLEKAAADIVLKNLNRSSPSLFSTIKTKLLQFGVVRAIVGKIITHRLAAKINKAHYPAPFAIVDNWVKFNIYNEKIALQEELKSMSKLATSGGAENLIRVFGLREQLKSLAKQQKFAKPNSQHVHVVGAGVMGGDIAIWCVLRGYRVTLQDKNIIAINNTLLRANKLFTKKFKLPHLIQDAKDRLIPDLAGLGVSLADVIIEAIVENVKLKQDLFVDLEREAKLDAILATNTSSITLEAIRANLKNKERLVGVHFFNPVEKMPLVEIVYDKVTDPEVKNKAIAFVGSLDKLPLPVKSCPGFLVNRILLPYLLESIAIYQEGVEPFLIDNAAKNFGMPMGPMELIDTVGLDVCKDAAITLNIQMPEVVNDMIKAGKLGKKTGSGFYEYKNGKRVTNFETTKCAQVDPAPKDTQDRLIMRMLNESSKALSEGIVENEDLLDAGMIFGAGFAPFLGGPMHYIKEKKIKVL